MSRKMKFNDSDPLMVASCVRYERARAVLLRDSNRIGEAVEAEETADFMWSRLQGMTGGQAA